MRARTGAPGPALRGVRHGCGQLEQSMQPGGEEACLLLLSAVQRPRLDPSGVGGDAAAASVLPCRRAWRWRTPGHTLLQRRQVGGGTGPCANCATRPAVPSCILACPSGAPRLTGPSRLDSHTRSLKGAPPGLVFDHAAQFFTATHPAFKAMVRPPLAGPPGPACSHKQLPWCAKRLLAYGAARTRGCHPAACPLSAAPAQPVSSSARLQMSPGGRVGA